MINRVLRANVNLAHINNSNVNMFLIEELIIILRDKLFQFPHCFDIKHLIEKYIISLDPPPTLTPTSIALLLSK